MLERFDFYGTSLTITQELCSFIRDKQVSITLQEYLQDLLKKHGHHLVCTLHFYIRSGMITFPYKRFNISDADLNRKEEIVSNYRIPHIEFINSNKPLFSKGLEGQPLLHISTSEDYEIDISS
ncbi:hypothetical protein AKO1_011245 [Acrasis kona]|uniref:Uncharacterized protein n=1 Tax=Acrasis kona TaxID=1008807 RepID=A0AAW2YWE8_9EUKA